MATEPDEDALAALLPGTWAVAASNLPHWLNGERRGSTLSYEVVGTQPLVLAEELSYELPDGTTRHTPGTDTRIDGAFVWRGRGWRRFAPTRWTVVGVSDDRSVIAVRFWRSRITPAGLDLLVRDGVTPPELRAIVAHDTASYGLSAEDFGSLAWMDQHGPRRTP